VRFVGIDDGNLITPPKPAAQVNQLAALGAEWIVRLLPLGRFGDLLLADRTDHHSDFLDFFGALGSVFAGEDSGFAAEVSPAGGFVSAGLDESEVDPPPLSALAFSL
jgi:hypothetical protein